MKTQLFKLATAFSALAAISACSGKADADPKDAITSYLGALENGIPSEFFKVVTGSFTESMQNDGLTDLMQKRSVTRDDITAMIASEYSGYADEIDEALITTIAGKITPDVANQLKEWSESEQKISVIECAISADELEPKLAECSEELGIEFSEEEIARAASFTDTYVEVITGPTGFAYFGGATCRVQEELYRRLSTETEKITLNELTLSFGETKDKPCDELRDELVDLRTDANPGVLIMR